MAKSNSLSKAIQEQLQKYPGIRYSTPEWRTLFSDDTLAAGQKLVDEKKIYTKRSWYAKTFGFTSLGKPVVEIRHIPSCYGDSWKKTEMTCTCRQKRCAHMAAALLTIEQEDGPVVLWENVYDYQLRTERDKRLRQWEEQVKAREKDGLVPVPALTAFQNQSLAEPVIFDLEKALASYHTTAAAIRRLPEARKCLASYPNQLKISSNGRGEEHVTFHHVYQVGPVRAQNTGILFPETLSLSRERHLILNSRESVPIRGYETGAPALGFRKHSESPEEMEEEPEYGADDDAEFNEPETQNGRQGAGNAALLDEFDLADIELLWDAVNQRAAQSVTDGQAESFFRSMKAQREEKVPKAVSRSDEPPEKNPCVELMPRILVTDGEPTLSFRIGLAGGRLYVVKNCYTLIEAAERGTQLLLGKAEKLDFSKQTFRPESLALYDFIRRHKAQSYGGLYQIPLKNSAIDNFYDMSQNVQCDYLDKTNNIKSDHVHVGHTDIRFTLTADRLADARGNFLGIVVSGMVPVLVKGNSYRYFVTPQALSRISSEEQRVLTPFLDVADDSGYFRFQLGKDRLQEFYYRVLPALLENPFVQFVDHCEEEASAFLPPEPQFSFFLDLEDSRLSLRTTVRYGSREVPLIQGGDSPDGYRDKEQEAAVIATISLWLPYEKSNVFAANVSDEQLFDFLTTGVPTLEFYGVVKGTSAFRSRKVTPPPHVQLGISVEGGGLLDISVTSQELSAKDLLALYDSYTKKKRYYRLRSGDFIDLTRNDELKELEAFLGQLEITPREVIQKKLKLPLYRALYLNRMLESHDQLATTRDRTYRALIRNFKTIRDAEFEVPAVLENVLRPYQVYGYKWLRTLQEAGFGGILADEMGLGKTVQMISVFQADLEREKEHLPSLVICPASLVYNWQEEIRRFAPQLQTAVIAGTAGAREKLLQTSGGADVLITSYDLLKRDIALYESMSFRHCVLDEAQYIKNSRSAAAKSVKIIRAAHRFALTGTPIENRLLELWSVFDFLMPGFLYQQADFEKRFELPIAKMKDAQMTEKLKSMVSPFILRRKKSDVLQDLPEKLEEIRYARPAGEQQKLYDAQVVRMKQMLSGGELAGEEKIRVFAELTRIRQICCDPSLLMENYTGESAKREACMELILSAMEGGHRMLIFSQFVSMLDLLEKDLQKNDIPYFKLIGATSKEKRISMVRAFNEGDTPVFLISLKAGGTGLNLTGADVVIHYDPWWNLAAQNQATDRAHRIGQTKRVTVFKLILKGTIEERIVALQEAKKELAEAVLEGEQSSLLALSNEELLSLLE